MPTHSRMSDRLTNVSSTVTRVHVESPDFVRACQRVVSAHALSHAVPAWIFRVARMTDYTLSTFQSAIEGTHEHIAVSISSEEWLEWLQGAAENAKKSAMLKSHDEQIMTFAVLDSPLKNVLYVALTASVLLINGISWIIEAIDHLQEVIDAIEVDCDNSESEDESVNTESSDELERLNDIRSTFHELLGPVINAAEAAEELLPAIQAGSLQDIMTVVQGGSFALDIGQGP